MTQLTTRGHETRDAILFSARQELTLSGILGLRVAEVATRANTSVTSIYRLFGDRDGLLAQVLGDIMEEIVEGTVERFRRSIRGRSNLTVTELVDAIPLKFAFQNINHKFRLQILAAATENPVLEERLHSVFVRRHDLWKEALAETHACMTPGEDFDERVFFLLLTNHMPYYNYLLGDMGATEEQFKQFLADKLRADPQTRRD